MKVQKNINFILFFDIFFCVIAIILVSLGFFLGFELSNDNLLIYFIVIIAIMVFSLIFYMLYRLLCKTYIEFTEKGIFYVKKNFRKEMISYNNIKYIEYYKIYTLFLGDTKGGKLLVYQKNKEECIEIGISMKRLKKLPYLNKSV